MSVPETFFSVGEELRLFGLSCLFGAAFGLLYDVFRAARLILGRAFWLVFAEDILFLGAYALFLPVFVSAAARGELRFYFVLGNLAGFGLYLASVGNAVSGALRRLIFALAKALRLLCSPFRRGFVLLRRKAGGKFVGYSKNIVNRFKKLPLLLPNSRLLLYNKKVNIKRKNVTNVGKKKG